MELPMYPGAQAREVLAPSQIATLNKTIASALALALNLPQDKRDKPSSIAFISSYAKDHAKRILHTLIWESESTPTSHIAKLSKVERTIHERTLRLVERSSKDIDLQCLIDLAVVYGPTNTRRFRAILLSIPQDSQVIKGLEAEAVPAFTALLLSNAQGLYGIRKISYIIWAFLCCAPPDLIRPFARNKNFVLALAKAYDEGLSACARSYGGLRPDRIAQSAKHAGLDDWERIFLETKVTLIDSFHIVIRTLLNDVAEVSSTGPALAARCEVAFEIVFALTDLPSPQLNEADPISFLNQSLLADYQQTYGLSRLLSEATRSVDDPRTEYLESTLQALDNDASVHPQARSGALKLLIRSPGAQPGIDLAGQGRSRVDERGKGKEVMSTLATEQDPALDAAVSQVLDIFPEQSPQYVRFVLSHPDYPYNGDAERLIGALLEGTAPSLGEYEAAVARAVAHSAAGSILQEMQPAGPHDTFIFTKERRNIFDEEPMDLSKIRVGKKTDDGALQDKAYMDHIKAEILRIAEEMSDPETEVGRTAKEKGVDVAFEDELEEGGFKVRDGEDTEEVESGNESTDDGDDEVAARKSPETILELAYIADPTVFDRDAGTRRSKARSDLRAQTGWADEQLEGWRIMLERNPNKDRILQKHEFAGNKREAILTENSHPSQQSPPRGRGYGRGRGRGGGGHGRGRGGRNPDHDGGSNGGGSGGGSARERAWKDKNKASRANHNRKRGHDKKMARASGPA